jgi:photosystem II stability/assembly factor-like uncharacterized protein
MSATLLVGTQKGALVLRSDDARQHWSAGSLQLKGWLVTAFARDETGLTYAAVTHDVWGAVIMASHDLETWEQLESAPRYLETQKGNAGHNRIIGAMDPMEQFSPGGRHVDQIWKLLAVGDTLYAGVSEAGLFRSRDRGKSWQVLPGIDRHPHRDGWVPGFGGLCLHSILVDAHDPNRIWAGISSAGAFRSDDGGESFASINDGVVSGGEGWCVHSLAHDSQNADVIYRQDHQGVYKTTNGGDSWTRIESGLKMSTLSNEHECSFGFASGLDPQSGTAFIVPMEGDSFRFPHGGELTVARTTDGGQNWQPMRQGLPDDCWANVLRGAMALDHHDPCGVYFGTTGGSVYSSADRGESWSRLSSDLPKILCVEAFANA